uniref:Uncharacterized protein n=1 Tax=Rhizophora mucronata TaxID=61149 RepID=A0A2P2PHA8_RHIMU
MNQFEFENIEFNKQKRKQSRIMTILPPMASNSVGHKKKS